MTFSKTIYSVFAGLLLLMVAVISFAVSANSYESTEIIDIEKINEAKVIIYGTPQCHYCKKTRKLLSENNVPFYEYDISKNAQAYQTFKRLEGRGTPLIVIGDQVIKGYDENRILALATN